MCTCVHSCTQTTWQHCMCYHDMSDCSIVYFYFFLAPGTCQCDQGYTGADCGTATGSFTSSLVDNFDTTVLASSPNWYSALGVTVGATCHVISDGKAAIFK